MHDLDDSLFKGCIELLGKDKDHIAFQRLKERLKQDPVLVAENANVACYQFRQYGIELIYKKSRAFFGWAVFFVNSPNVRQGTLQRYAGVFLSGVTSEDSMLEVEHKMDLAPSARDSSIGAGGDDSVLRYELQKQNVSFFFDGAGRQMRIVLVKFKSERKPPAAS